MKATIYSYSKDSKKIKRQIKDFKDDIDERENELINIYPEVQYQIFYGFGGAITQSAGKVILSAPKRIRDRIMNICFGKKGLNYKIIRAPLDSCDFSDDLYSSYCEKGLPEIEVDKKYIIPLIKQSYRISEEDLPVMLSPWSPPGFMKTNGERKHGGTLKKEHYEAWADYLCRYVLAYRNEGINVTAVSVQNEPHARQQWESCEYSGEEERLFAEEYLRPKLNDYGLDDIEIYLWDHNKERLFERAREVEGKKDNNYFSGFNFHWYSGDHFDAVRLTHEKYPDKRLIFSEGCIEYSRYNSNEYNNAEKYAHDIIGNLNAGMDTFIDWNITLNEKGGPNHTENYCESPIIYDTVHKIVNLQLSYYYISLFSRYVQPGAKRIATTCFTSDLELTAFLNPDGNIAVTVLNRTSEKKRAFLRIEEKLLELRLEDHSIKTIIIER